MSGVREACRRRLEAETERAAEGPGLLGPFRLMTAIAQLRDGDPRGLSALGDAPPAMRLRALLAAASTGMAATDEVRGAIRESLGALDEPPAPELRALGLWAGMTQGEVGLDRQRELVRAVVMVAAVRLGVPPNLPALASLVEGRSGYDTDRALSTFAAERHVDEIDLDRLVSAIANPLLRVGAMCALAGRQGVPRPHRERWTAWAQEARASAKASQEGDLERALFDAGLGGFGEPASLARTAVERALIAAKRARDPKTRGLIHQALAAASLAGEPGVWPRVASSLLDDPVLAGVSLEYAERRAELLRALSGRARVGFGDRPALTKLIDALWRPSARRILTFFALGVSIRVAPDPRTAWIELEGRLDGGLGAPASWLPLDEVLGCLASADAGRAVALGDRLGKPLERAIWWATLHRRCPANQAGG